ncbi:MAG TPA: DUF1015 domain-containing protein, partial [Balneolales bacterium]|nr:DUF1015 domain-containing protein [Balneolales bacterium]
MAVIHPFKAWRPKANKVKEIACVPYDVIDTDEARELANGLPDSYLHVIRPEIDLPEDVDIYDDRVYEQGAKNLQAMMSDGRLVQEDAPSLYVYRLTMDGRDQTGLFTCVSVQDYDDDVILKHEQTRHDKEKDRTRHILTQQAHAEPVMLAYRDVDGINQLTAGIMNGQEPIYDFTANDGIHHTIWKVEDTGAWVEQFKAVPNLYVADGHHRCKSASTAAAEKLKNNTRHSGEEEYDFFPAVLFPMGQMHIMAYNRVVHKIPDNFLDTLRQHFDLKPTDQQKPMEKGHVSIYLDNKWYDLELPVNENATAVESLDVYRLQNFLLEPLLGIKDPRSDKNISFVGGIRGTKELVRLVDSGKASIAISMYPTSIEELADVSDAGLL